MTAYVGGSTKFNRRHKSSNWRFAPFITNFKTISYNSKICKTGINSTFYRLAFWKRNCYATVIQCSLTTPLGACS
jgi:hypothetical protein